MNKLSVSFLLISFVLWILPLGYFIKPSQENLACDGQRAICMCHVMMKVHSSDKVMEAGMAIKASATNKENSSGGGSSYFVSSRPIVNLNPSLVNHFENQFLSYKNPYLVALEYVPKI